MSVAVSAGETQPDLLSQVAEEVRLVEEELAQQVQSQVELVAKIAAHTLSAGGKRLRPALVSLSARATGLPYDLARARKLGACMELIHMATLVHDDVIDETETRRGRPTASSVFGNTGAILTGDVLLAKAMSILAQDGDLEIIRCVSAAVVEMAEGEVREVELRGRFDLAETEHLDVLRMKTASFIECCCLVGALVAASPKPLQYALKTYGAHIGLAFQIADDLLDYRGSEAKTGKPLGTDFREGCATLPLILLREKLGANELEQVEKGFGNGATDADIQQVIQSMRERGAFEHVERLAQDHLDAAVSALASLPQTHAKTLLASVAEFVLRRDG